MQISLKELKHAMCCLKSQLISVGERDRAYTCLAVKMLNQTEPENSRDHRRKKMCRNIFLVLPSQCFDSVSGVPVVQTSTGGGNKGNGTTESETN